MKTKNAIIVMLVLVLALLSAIMPAAASWGYRCTCWQGENWCQNYWYGGNWFNTHQLCGGGGGGEGGGGSQCVCSGGYQYCKNWYGQWYRTNDLQACAIM